MVSEKNIYILTERARGKMTNDERIVEVQMAQHINWLEGHGEPSRSQ